MQILLGSAFGVGSVFHSHVLHEFFKHKHQLEGERRHAVAAIALIIINENPSKNRESPRKLVTSTRLFAVA